jgi:hypothetical protein
VRPEWQGQVTDGSFHVTSKSDESIRGGLRRSDAVDTISLEGTTLRATEWKSDTAGEAPHARTAATKVRSSPAKPTNVPRRQ